MGESIAIFNSAGEVILLLNKLSLPYNLGREIQINLYKRAKDRNITGCIEEVSCEVYRGHLWKNGDTVIIVMTSVFDNPYEGKILLTKVKEFCKSFVAKSGEIRADLVVKKNVELMNSLEDILHGMEPRLTRRDFFALTNYNEDLHLPDKTAWIVQASKPWTESDIYTSAKTRGLYDLQNQYTLLNLQISLPDSCKVSVSEYPKHPFAPSFVSAVSARDSYSFLRKSVETSRPQRPSFSNVDEDLNCSLESQDSFQPVSTSILKMCRVVIMVCDK